MHCIRCGSVVPGTMYMTAQTVYKLTLLDMPSATGMSAVIFLELPREEDGNLETCGTPDLEIYQ